MNLFVNPSVAKLAEIGYCEGGSEIQFPHTPFSFRPARASTLEKQEKMRYDVFAVEEYSFSK